MYEGQFTVRVSVVPADDANGLPVCDANPARVALLIADQSGSGTVDVAPVGWGSDDGIITVPATGMMEFFTARHGPLASSAWISYGTIGIGPLTVIEVIALRR